MKITKIRKSGQNWHFYLSIKQIITLEIVINSLSEIILKNATVGFYSFSQSCDPLKNLCSLVTQIYAPKNGGISLIKRFFSYAVTRCNFPCLATCVATALKEELQIDCSM